MATLEVCKNSEKLSWESRTFTVKLDLYFIKNTFVLHINGGDLVSEQMKSSRRCPDWFFLSLLVMVTFWFLEFSLTASEPLTPPSLRASLLHAAETKANEAQAPDSSEVCQLWPTCLRLMIPAPSLQLLSVNFTVKWNSCRQQGRLNWCFSRYSDIHAPARG